MLKTSEKMWKQEIIPRLRLHLE